MTCVLLIYKIFKRGFLHDSKRADTYLDFIGGPLKRVGSPSLIEDTITGKKGFSPIWEIWRIL